MNIPFVLAEAAPECLESAGTAGMPFAFWGSLSVFLLVLVFFMFRKFISPVVTVILAIFISLLLRFTDFAHAASSIDLNALFLICSMMISTSILSESGFFEWAVVGLTKLLKGNVFFILFILLMSSMFFSAFLTPVMTVFLVVPLAIMIAKVLELPVEPILIFVLVAANLGGASTLLGGIPNMILGAGTGLIFDDFILHAAPCVMGIGILFFFLVTVLMSSRLAPPAVVRTKVDDFCPTGAIVNLRKMRSAFAIFAFMILAFIFQPFIGVQPGITAMLGMALMLAIYRPDTEKLMKYIDWQTIIVLCGLFILTGALLQNGVTETLGEILTPLGGKSLFLLCMAVLWGAAFLSSVIDSMALILCLLPLLTRCLNPQLSLPDGGDNPLYWALLFGICLGGCGSLFGSPANLLLSRMARANGIVIPVRRFFYWGFPLMLLQLLICSVYLWLRYFIL